MAEEAGGAGLGEADCGLAPPYTRPAAAPAFELLLGALFFAYGLLVSLSRQQRHAKVSGFTATSEPPAATTTAASEPPAAATTAASEPPVAAQDAVRRPQAAKEALVVSDLLATHRKSLSQLRASVEDHPHFKPGLHDSIFLLRFLLSHPPARGSVAAATRALRRALTIRAENDLDRIGAYVLANPSRNWVGGRWRWWSHMLPVLMCQPEADGPAFMMGRVKDFDMHGVVRDLPRADFSRATMYLMEWIFQVMDRATRRTGVIVKYHRLLDVSGVSLSQVSLRFVRRDADDNKELQCLYPQLLGSVCFLNPPPAIRWLWGSVLAPLMPRKVTEKTLMLMTTSSRDLEVLERYCPSHLRRPEFGGTCTDTIADPTEHSPAVAAAGAAAADRARRAGASLKATCAALFAASDAAEIDEERRAAASASETGSAGLSVATTAEAGRGSGGSERSPEWRREWSGSSTL